MASTKAAKVCGSHLPLALSPPSGITSSSRKRLSPSVASHERHGDGDGDAASAPKPASKRAKKQTPTPAEKRMARYLASPSSAIMERIHRAYQHRLYLIDKTLVGDPHDPISCEFFVLGATGNVYSVKLEKLPSCTCPDFSRGHVCKHLLFVYLRVLKLSRSDPRIWQKALLSSELQDLLHKSAVGEAVLASQRVRERFQEITGRTGKETEKTEKIPQKEVEGDCPICYELMGGEEMEPVVFCRVCGNNVHRDCFQKWSRGKRGNKVTCIYCRGVWEDPSLKKKGKKKETASGGYLNLASYSEDHPAEDTTLEALYPDTYEWFAFGGRSRQRRDS